MAIYKILSPISVVPGKVVKSGTIELEDDVAESLLASGAIKLSMKATKAADAEKQAAEAEAKKKAEEEAKAAEAEAKKKAEEEKKAAEAEAKKKAEAKGK